MKLTILKLTFIGCLTVASFTTVNAQETEAKKANAEELAKQLANPVASLISVPFQNNTDYGIGAFNGSRNTLNFQPVFPLKLTTNLNLITRLVLPIVSQHDITGAGNEESGLSDALLSAIVSPAIPKNGLIWGVGPAILVPTATNDFLGTKKWGVGPQALVLKQANGWTYGMLANQVWSFAGDNSRADVNQMFLQPFLIYNWKSGAGVNAVAEITQNWEAETTTAFFIPSVSGVTKLGSQTISLVFGPRIPLSAPSGGKPDFGFRGGVTFVFPK
jgi:hypothetical protein